MRAALRESALIGVNGKQLAWVKPYRLPLCRDIDSRTVRNFGFPSSGSIVFGILSDFEEVRNLFLGADVLRNGESL